MIRRPQNFRFPLIALLAQILLCLAAAPVIGAQESGPQRSEANGSKQNKRDKENSRLAITAAFDSSNVRPEDVSDSGQRKRNGKTRTGGTASGADGANAGHDFLPTAHESQSAAAPSECGIERTAFDCSKCCEIRAIKPATRSAADASASATLVDPITVPRLVICVLAPPPVSPCLCPSRVLLPALQPTGPPARA